MTPAENLSVLLRRYNASFARITSLNLNDPAVVKLDMSAVNAHLKPENIASTPVFWKLINQMLQENQGTIGIGGYLENRVIYKRSALFDKPSEAAGTEARTVHLGIDIWAHVGTSVYTPIAATVHSFADNANFGDYGPTIVLQHELEGTIFYTLYGHLSRESLQGLAVGKPFRQGDKIGEFGNAPENGDWPPHLHFQIMTDMLGFTGDFPGVCAPSEVEKFKAICPDPNLIIRSRHLGSGY